MWDLLTWGAIILLGLTMLSGLRIVRPTECALIERLGKYNRFAKRGLNFTIPFFESIIKVNVTETMVDADEQEDKTNWKFYKKLRMSKKESLKRVGKRYLKDDKYKTEIEKEGSVFVMKVYVKDEPEYEEKEVPDKYLGHSLSLPDTFNKSEDDDPW